MEIKEISGAKYKLPSDSEKAKCKEKMEKMRKEGDKLVKGMFEFLDAQGGWLDFSYRFFPGEPCRTVRITHGEIVDLPMILVRHLNNVWKKVRQMPKELNENGKPMERPFVERVSRCRFTPMDVM
jgi:hypothetical protein